MRRVLFALACLLLAARVAWAQQVDTLAAHYAATMTEADLRANLSVLASDAYEGRETGMEGQKMAARYITARFQEYGIPPVPNAGQAGLLQGYQQSYPVELSRPGGISLVVNGTVLGFMQDYFYFSEKMQDTVRTDQVVFMGRGDEAAYVDKDVRGRVVLVLLPQEDAIKQGDRPPPGFFQALTRLTETANKAGASLLLVGCGQAPAMMREYAHFITTPRMKLDVPAKVPEHKALQAILLDQPSTERILKGGGLSWKKAFRKIDHPGRAMPCALQAIAVPDRQELHGENILGYVEGGDLKDQLVLVTAHYDHIGKDGKEVYNGADDDGSGTVAVLELARAFARAKSEGHGPRRSMLFMTVSGEEKGLLGSQWYSEHPVFPLSSTVADLNIDMIGRVDSAHMAADHYVYVIGSDRLSTELHRINEAANARYTHLDLDYTYNAESDPNRYYYRSDHYNFARFGVPVIFYFNGVHADYHQPTDEVDKIRFDLLLQRARLVFYTAWELADRDQRIVVDKAPK